MLRKVGNLNHATVCHNHRGRLAWFMGGKGKVNVTTLLIQNVI